LADAQMFKKFHALHEAMDLNRDNMKHLGTKDLVFYSKQLLARISLCELSLPLATSLQLVCWNSLPVINWNVFWARRGTWSSVWAFIRADWFTRQWSCWGLRWFDWRLTQKRLVLWLFFHTGWQFYSKHELHDYYTQQTHLV
jgi:hypothetical protein